MHIYGNVVFFEKYRQTWNGIFTERISGSEPQGIECYNNIAIQIETGIYLCYRTGIKIETTYC